MRSDLSRCTAKGRSWYDWGMHCYYPECYRERHDGRTTLGRRSETATQQSINLAKFEALKDRAVFHMATFTEQACSVNEFKRIRDPEDHATLPGNKPTPGI